VKRRNYKSHKLFNSQKSETQTQKLSFYFFFSLQENTFLEELRTWLSCSKKVFFFLSSFHWLSLCVVSTSPTYFIFHFCFSLGHLCGFHGKRLVFVLVLGMDNALVVWIVSRFEESFLLGPKVSSLLPFLHLKPSSLSLIGKESFIFFYA